MQSSHPPLHLTSMPSFLFCCILGRGNQCFGHQIFFYLLSHFLASLFSWTFLFLQVCDWLYPLMAMDSPVLLCNTGVFMFPDMMAPAPGYYVGVVLSSELPAADRALFQDLLSQMTDLRVQVSVLSDLQQHNTCSDTPWGTQKKRAYIYLYPIYI